MDGYESRDNWSSEGKPKSSSSPSDSVVAGAQMRLVGETATLKCEVPLAARLDSRVEWEKLPSAIAADITMPANFRIDDAALIIPRLQKVIVIVSIGCLDEYVCRLTLASTAVLSRALRDELRASPLNSRLAVCKCRVVQSLVASCSLDALHS